jgi:hypothetical protein
MYVKNFVVGYQLVLVLGDHNRVYLSTNTKKLFSEIHDQY